MTQHRIRRLTALAVIFGLGLISVPAAQACKHCRGCGPSCAPTYQTVEKTVMVPTTVMEERHIQCVEYRPEIRQQTVTAYRRVPVTQAVTRNYTVMVPHTQTRTVNYRVCKPVTRQVEKQYTVCVPRQVTRQAVRTVCKRVPVQQTRTVCRDHGHWDSQPACGESSCCQCAPCKVWVPNIVKEEVPVTVWKTQTEQVPYEYTDTIYERQVRTKTVPVVDYVYETKTREVPYTVCKPEVRTKTFNVTSYRCEAYEKTVDRRVMVPHTVDKVVNVRVCKMVPKQVTYRVAVGGCSSCCL